MKVKNGYKIEKFPNFYYTKNHNGITQCSGEINKFFLEMDWENRGVVWEIDHIKPCASFDLTNIEQQKE